MRKIKVFISSVIEEEAGYKDRRDAVEEATVELNRDGRFNFEAVRVDRFPAQDKSSQKACLDSVNESDIYLGIYGKSYGWKDSPVGLSPTHEEFREAKNKKPILVFVEDIPKEERESEQREFLKEVEDYVDGHYRKKFKIVSDLKHEVYRALLDLMNAEFEQCLQDYSKSLLQNLQNERERINRQWGENIEPLRISEIVQLELMEEKKDEKQKEENSERINKRLTPSDALKEQRLLIVGDAGAGKSTLLQWITYTYAEQILKSQNLPVPVYLELKWYKDNLRKLIEDHFSKNNVECNEERVIDWIKKGGFLFLLDGFDELDDPMMCLKDIKELMSFSKENRFVVTSRRVDSSKVVEDLEFQRVEVKHLSDSQIELFIEKYLGKERGFRLLKDLEKQDLLKEARNPLILWFMILEFQREESQISLNRGMLFKNVIEHRFLKEWERKHAKEVYQKYTNLKITVLSKLAFAMIGIENSVKIKEVKAEEIIYSLLKEGRKDYKEIGYTIKEQLLASHVLIKVGSQLSFWHKNFREYFAALELLELFSRDPEEFVKRYATKRWKESILFLVGIMDDEPSDFVDRLVQPFWRYFLRSQYPTSFRLSLAAKCIGVSNKIKSETQDKVINLLCNIIKWEEKYEKRYIPGVLWCPIVSNTAAMRALGETNKEKAAEFLGDFLTNHACRHIPCVFCQDAFEALENMPKTEKILNSLLFAALWHEDKSVRFHAADVLREYMTQDVALKLVKTMLSKDEKSYIRERAIHITCGDVFRIDFITNQISHVELKRPEIVIDPLIQIALQEEYDGLGGKAASALGYYNGEDKEEKIVNPLIHALHKNHESNIRVNAAHALIYHFSHKVRNALIQALSDDNARVRIQAAYTLSYVGIKTPEEENEASRKLSRLFSDEDPTVRQNAVYTYGIIGQSPTDEELSLLINLLRDNNISVRHRAAEALGRLKARAALDALKQMVYDEKYADSWASAIWAILQIEPSFSEVIKENNWEYPYIMQLSDDDIDNRRVAVDVLGRIGTEKSIPVLKEMYRDYDESSDIRGKLYYAIQDIEDRIKTINK
jgi:HEAT repeat protein/tRNA A37 threonylcarbamoyladenosine biosynthesis protein TsaE